MHTEIRLDLVLTGFAEHPNEISGRLAMQPTRYWLKGEQILDSALKRKTNGWLLSSALRRDADFDDHLQHLTEKLEPIKQRFADLPASTHVELSCAAYIYCSHSIDEEHNTPSIHLKPQHVSLLNQLNAAFDLDLYVLPAKAT